MNTCSSPEDEQQKYIIYQCDINENKQQRGQSYEELQTVIWFNSYIFT